MQGERASRTSCGSTAARKHGAPLSFPFGESIRLSAAESSDPDGDALTFGWAAYPEVSTHRGVLASQAEGSVLVFEAPPVTAPETIHRIVAVTDRGSPPLTRYQRIVCTVLPRSKEPVSASGWEKIKSAFVPAESNEQIYAFFQAFLEP